MNIELENFDFIDTNKDINSQKEFTVTSLFSGCGGMDLGFRGDFNVIGKQYGKNNFKILFANDIEESACKTYEFNFKHKPVSGDIRNILCEKIPKADIVLGGFPCQDFSLAGNRNGLNAERGRLYLEMKRVVEYSKPMAFVAENVDGIRTSKHSNGLSAVDIILEDFKNIGYAVKYKVLNAADYGVPQTRIRVIIIGIRNDLGKSIKYPQTIKKENCTINPWVTSEEAIDDLWDKIGVKHIYNHSELDYSKAKFYPGKKMQGNYKIQRNKPSNTIRAEHHGNIETHYRTKNPLNPEDMLHWRRLSVRECARIQTFPDNFIFPCSASKAYKQIGNAVPPVLAWHIARALYFSLL